MGSLFEGVPFTRHVVNGPPEYPCTPHSPRPPSIFRGPSSSIKVSPLGVVEYLKDSTSVHPVFCPPLSLVTPYLA